MFAITSDAGMSLANSEGIGSGAPRAGLGGFHFPVSPVCIFRIKCVSVNVVDYWGRSILQAPGQVPRLGLKSFAHFHRLSWDPDSATLPIWLCLLEDERPHGIETSQQSEPL